MAFVVLVSCLILSCLNAAFQCRGIREYANTAFTKNMGTQNCLAGIQNVSSVSWLIWFWVIDNIARYRHATSCTSVCKGCYVRRFYVRQRCLLKIALVMLTMKTRWCKARIWFQLVYERHTSIRENFGLLQSNKFIWLMVGVFPMSCATYRDSPCSMPHNARSSLEPALGHEMPPLLQVACPIFIYAIGCDFPFQLGLQMTSNILWS